jgi:putative membrane protein
MLNPVTSPWRGAEEEDMRTLATILAVGLAMAAFPALSDDAAFLRTLAENGRAEVQSSELAANKATSDEVREFAKMLVKDHGAANQKVANLARAKGVALPEALGTEKAEMMKSLASQSGARFDQEYLAHMTKAHEKSVKLLQSEVAGSGSADTRALAQELLPTVEHHLHEAHRLTGKGPAAASKSPDTTGG